MLKICFLEENGKKLYAQANLVLNIFTQTFF